MNPEEAKSNNARPTRDEENLTDYVMVDEETTRFERSEEDSEKRIVIFTCNMSLDETWMNEIINRRPLNFIIIKYTQDFISQYSDRSPPTIIFSHSMKSENNLSYLKDSLENCIAKFGQERVNVVISDLKDTKSALEVQQEWRTWDYPCCQLLTLTHAEMDGIKNPLMEKQTYKMEVLKKILLNANGDCRDMGPGMKRNKPKLQIGIFSLSDKEDYSWLMSLLKSADFKDLVGDIRPYYIYNNTFLQFMNDVHQCTFTILYHTANRGRINITDMEGSLYDKELAYLHKCLESKRVIVVIDDLEDSSDQRKTQILRDQPSIGKCAQDLLMFSKEEKASDYIRFFSSFQKKKKKFNAMILAETLEVEEDRKGKETGAGRSSGHTVQNLPVDGNSDAKPAGQIHREQDLFLSHSGTLKRRERTKKRAQDKIRITLYKICL